MTAKGMVAAIVLAITVCVAAGCTTDKESGGENGGDSGAVTQAIMEIDGREAAVTLAESEAAEALVSLLRGGDITFVTDDYGGFEKTGALGHRLPAADEHIAASPGDVMLYRGTDISVFYGSNTWSYTRLGRIDLPVSELRGFLGAGEGETEITLKLPAN